MAAQSTSSNGGVDRPMESRTGRTNQRYTSKGERLVAGIVPVTEDRQWVLLIQSTRRKGWVLPKGGWESDEEVTEAASREAWEEAGIEIRIDYDLGSFKEHRKPKHTSGDAKKTNVMHFFEAVVVKEFDDWPESHKRIRQWMSFADAKEELKGRPELQDALIRSTLLREEESR